MCDTKKDTWDNHLPLALLGYNASVQKTTKITPAELVYGFKIPLPWQGETFVVRDIGSDNEEAAGEEDDMNTNAEHLDVRKRKLQHLEAMALAAIDRSQDKMRQYSEREALNKKTCLKNWPDTGDFILLRSHKTENLDNVWETQVYMSAGYNKASTQVIVEDADGRMWAENV